MNQRRVRIVVALILTALLVRCTSEPAGPDPSKPTAVSLVSGNSQTGTVGQALGLPLSVRVVNSRGAGIAAIVVNWTVASGGGSFPTSSIPTDANGNATIAWTVGTTPGPNTATATISELAGTTINFAATARAGPSVAITKISGDAQTDTIDAILAVPLVVELRDLYGNLITDVTIDWAVTGGGSVSPTSSRTDATGRASTVRTLGGTAGTNTATTTAGQNGVANVVATFTGSVTRGKPASVTIAGGDLQSALAATGLPNVLRARTGDRHGNGIDDIAVQWEARPGSGTVTAVEAISANGGIATAHWTLGSHPIIDTAVVTATGIATLPSIRFKATALPNGTIEGSVGVTSTTSAPLATKAAAAAVGAQLSAAPIALGMRTRGSVGLRSRKMFVPSRAVPKPPRDPQFARNELIVRFQARRLNAPAIGSRAFANAATAQAAAHAMRERLGVFESSGDLRTKGVSAAILAARVQVDPARLEEVAERLRNDPAVASVERNGIVWRHAEPATRIIEGVAASAPTPNDPFYPYQAWHYAMIDAPEAWQITRGSSSVLVAVVDDGIRFDHPGVAANLTHDGFDFVADDPVPVCDGGEVSNAGDGDGYDADPTIPASYFMDFLAGCVMENDQYGGHGLFVAGIIGAPGNDGLSTAGVSWSVRIRPVRVLGAAGFGNDYDVAQGILYAAGLPADNGKGGLVNAATGARIINMSLGGPPSTVMQDAVIAATNAGALIIASAGNDGVSDPSYPAAYPQVISVSAVGPNGELTAYSNYGTTVDIAAPGGDAGSADATFGIISQFWDFVANAPIHSALDGTSFAAPHVTGVAALLLAQTPSLTAAQLRARLLDYAFDVGPGGPDQFYGAGIVNARNSLTQTLGYPRALFARVYDSASGAIVSTVGTGSGGSYQVKQLSDRAYYVYAGQDQAGDHQIGEPGRRWNAYGGTATPTPVVVDGAGTYPASFDIGFPSELEDNGTPGAADALALGGYLLGSISNPNTDADYSMVRVPSYGTYTFETFALDGACGFALEEDTIIELYTAEGTFIGSNDDIDYDGWNFCARLQVSLAPGTYFVRIIGYYGGRYQLHVTAPSDE